MPIVVDSSVALAWCFEDEASAYADRILDLLETDVAVVPAHFPVEIANGLITAERRRRLRAEDLPGAAGILESVEFLVLPVGVEEVLGIGRIGVDERLSAYDAAYLWLALNRRLSLATQDEELQAAAHAHGIVLA